MKCIKFITTFFIILIASSCQFQFKQTGNETYTLTGVKSRKTVERENQDKIQKRINRADFLLDSLNNERSLIIASYNIFVSIGRANEQTEKNTLEAVAQIDKKIEYVKKRKQEFLNELK